MLQGRCDPNQEPGFKHLNTAHHLFSPHHHHCLAPSATYARLPTWARHGQGQYLHTITRHAMSQPFTNPACQTRVRQTTMSSASSPCHWCHHITTSLLHQMRAWNPSESSSTSPTASSPSSLHYWPPNPSSPHHFSLSYFLPCHPPPTRRITPTHSSPCHLPLWLTNNEFAKCDWPIQHPAIPPPPHLLCPFLWVWIRSHQHHPTQLVASHTL